MERRVSDVVFDSRKVIENAAFVDVKGTQVDGHYFIPLAF
jgi:UDP-N-acetylmuramoyl-L-alanyl-D-glutamate--2,6-diaminopimelate ligase